MDFCNGWLVAMAALCVVACGGGAGGGAPPQAASEPSAYVKVVGDGLSDSGAFGMKYTVQGTPAYPIWVDKLAAALQMPAVCSRYTGLGGDPAAGFAASAVCHNHAVGGARVNTPGAPDTTPLSIVRQLQNLRAESAYGPHDLLLVNGGANDIADLTLDYLKVTSGDKGFQRTTSELLTSAEGAGVLRSWVGEAYATKLADVLADAITAHALDQGAQRVVVLAVPDLARTPRFIRLVAEWAANGGAAPIIAAEMQSHARGWSRRFNERLMERFAGENRVRMLDLRAEFNRWQDTPGDVGLTNTTRPACPYKEGRGLLGIERMDVDISACVDTGLSATPPAGESGPGWWRTYLFADDFHGTPRAHELIGEFAVRALEAKGWK